MTALCVLHGPHHSLVKRTTERPFSPCEEVEKSASEREGRPAGGAESASMEVGLFILVGRNGAKRALVETMRRNKHMILMMGEDVIEETENDISVDNEGREKGW